MIFYKNKKILDQKNFNIFIIKNVYIGTILNWWHENTKIKKTNNKGPAQKISITKTNKITLKKSWIYWLYYIIVLMKMKKCNKEGLCKK